MGSFPSTMKSCLQPNDTSSAVVSLRKKTSHSSSIRQRRSTASPFSTMSTSSATPTTDLFQNRSRQTCPGYYSGISHLKDATLNKGLGFSLAERNVLGVTGLLPHCLRDIDQQVNVCIQALNTIPENVDKYMYLVRTKNWSERLFFRLAELYLAKLIPILCMPTIGMVCVCYGLLYLTHEGLWIAIHDLGHVWDILCNWRENLVRVICVSTGSHVIGMGDLGAHAMAVANSKIALYTVVARIQPNQLVPILLDVGTNNLSMVTDPTYMGIRQRRVSDDQLLALFDELMTAVERRWSPGTFIHLMDFSTDVTMRLIEQYSCNYCIFSECLHGMAVAAVAAFLAAQRATHRRMRENIMLFVGAGQVSMSIADMSVTMMILDGASREEAEQHIWMMDSQGLVCTSRSVNFGSERKRRYAKAHPPCRNLLDVVRSVHPTVLIGASRRPGLFTPLVLREMAILNSRPVIMVLGNQPYKAECSPEAAYVATDGACLYVSAVPYAPFKYKGRTFRTGCCLTEYVYPSISLAVLHGRFRCIPNEVFVVVARLLAAQVTDVELARGSLYPLLERITQATVSIAAGLLQQAYSWGLATRLPVPVDMEAFVRMHMQDISHEYHLPGSYAWPEDATCSYPL